MPAFRYKAADAGGKVSEGTLRAAGRNEAVEQLHAQGFLPIRVDEASPGGGSGGSGQRLLPRLGSKRISHDQLVVITQELATLLHAGLPLSRALEILISLAETETVAEMLRRVQESIQGGSTLAEALEAQESVFSNFFINLVRAGEAGGALETVLQRLAEYLERSKEMRDTLLSAMIYPAILVFVAVLSIFILLGYVVPQFTELFEGVGEMLPLPTRVTIAVGNFVQSYGWVLIVAVVGLVMLIRYQLGNPRGRYRMHRWLLRAPLAGEVVKKAEVARFSRTLGALLNNGVPLLKAMGIARDTVGNQVIAESLEQVAGGLKGGQSLADPLAETGSFPPFAVHMIRVGEESGRLEEMLMQVADVYDRDMQTALKRTLALLEPLLILVLGVVIAAVVISILVAILGINDLVF